MMHYNYANDVKLDQAFYSFADNWIIVTDTEEKTRVFRQLIELNFFLLRKNIEVEW